MAGIDSSQEQIQLLEEGVYEALAIQKPFNMGYLGDDGISRGSLRAAWIEIRNSSRA